MFSKWLFSTNKFLYVNTTQNVYELAKKINFVACGLLRLFVSVGEIDVHRNFEKEKVVFLFMYELIYYLLMYEFYNVCSVVGCVALEFKFMDFEF